MDTGAYMQNQMDDLIMAKTMRDENQFKEEVKNLAKYFNAERVKER